MSGFTAHARTTTTGFDILASPASEPVPRGLVTTGRVVAVTLSTVIAAAGVWVATRWPAGSVLMVLAGLAGVGAAWWVGWRVDHRRGAARSWMEAESEVAWFQALRSPANGGDIDWDAFEQSFLTTHDGSAADAHYSAGFTAGYAQALGDAGSR